MLRRLPVCGRSIARRRCSAPPYSRGAPGNPRRLFALLVAIARGVRIGTDRRAHLLLAAGFVLTGVGAGLGMPSGRIAAPPDAFLGDALWLARYPLLYGSLALLLRARGPRFG